MLAKPVIYDFPIHLRKDESISSRYLSWFREDIILAFDFSPCLHTYVAKNLSSIDEAAHRQGKLFYYHPRDGAGAQLCADFYAKTASVFKDFIHYYFFNYQYGPSVAFLRRLDDTRFLAWLTADIVKQDGHKHWPDNLFDDLADISYVSVSALGNGGNNNEKLAKDRLNADIQPSDPNVSFNDFEKQVYFDTMKNLPLFRFLRNMFTKERTLAPQTNVAQHPRQPVHKRKKYRCFVCQPNRPIIDVIAQRIDAHPRLKNPSYGMLLTDGIDYIRSIAYDADILLLALDDHCQATDALLELPELRTKMVVIISDCHKSREKIKNRVDYWMPKEFIETDDDFQSLISPVIHELDNDYPQRQPTPMKSVYKCFIWQIGGGLMTRWIEESERLCVTYSCRYLTYSDQERAAVKEADVLILSSGGDSPDSLIYFLDHYDTRSKLVIVSTVFSTDRVLDRTPRRIDYVLEKYEVFNRKKLDRFFAPIIKDLDGGTN